MREIKRDDFPPEFLEALALNLALRPNDIELLNKTIKILEGDLMEMSECEK